MEDPSDNKVKVGYAFKSLFKHHWQGMLAILIPLICSGIMLKSFSKEFRCMFVISVMALFWITEVIPLYATALIPVIIFPALGILDSEVVCRAYFSNTVVMFFGGLVVALAIEYSNLHLRVALGTIMFVGCSPRRLHFGLVAVAGFISFWISNSATTAMMCPIIKAVLQELQQQNVIETFMTEEEEPQGDSPTRHHSKIALAYYFGIAYASSIGGCATLIGTGTNLTFKGIYDKRFPESTDKLEFPVFMAYNVPWVILHLFLLFFILQFTHMGLFRPNSKEAIEIVKAGKEEAVLRAVIVKKYEELGAWTCHEIQVIIIFLMMIILLFTMRPGFMTGWADLMTAVKIKNSMPVMACALFLMILPFNYTSWKYCCCKPGPFTNKETSSVLIWSYMSDNMPWGLMFLLGGGFALSQGSTASGMSVLLGDFLKFLEVLPIVIIQFLSILLGITLTAFSSNVAICNIIMPVLLELAVAIRLHPLFLLYPAGLACSLAYFLPVSTPPNAIISGYANIKTKYMAAAGFLPTIASILLLLLNTATWHRVIYPHSEFPYWAERNFTNPEE